MPGVLVRGALLILCMLGSVPGAWAQPGPQGRAQGGPGGNAMQPVTPAEVQRMLDGYVLIQAQDTLQLTDDQFARFVSRVRGLQETRRRSQVERQRMLQELRRMSAPRAGAVDEATLKDRLKALDDHDARAAAEIRQGQQAVDDVLTPVQQARFRIFEETMEQRKLELLMRARQVNRGRPQQPPPQPERSTIPAS